MSFQLSEDACPTRILKHHFYSLFAMYQFYAERIFWPLNQIHNYRMIVRVNPEWALSIADNKEFMAFLLLANQRCLEIDCPVTARKIKDVLLIIQMSKEKNLPSSPGEIMSYLDSIVEIMGTEMSNTFIFGITREEVTLYANKDPFTLAVTAKFPAITEDIQQATHCLVMGNTTACVFHLMRVMERLTQRLAVRMKLKFTGHGKPLAIRDATWDAILTAGHNKISAERKAGGLKAGRKRILDRYEETLIHLEHIKNAWRNPTMHPHQSYNELEAKNIFNLVNAYVQHLVKVL